MITSAKCAKCILNVSNIQNKTTFMDTHKNIYVIQYTHYLWVFLQSVSVMFDL